MQRGRKRGAAATQRKAIEAYHDVAPLVLTRRAEGATLSEIADELNRSGYGTQSGKRFRPVQVKRLLDRAWTGGSGKPVRVERSRMIRAGILALVVSFGTGAYPLGPFADVSWHAVFRSTPSLQRQSIQGRTYYTFHRGHQVATGTPLLVAMSVGPVGPQRAWLAAIPLDSGGSGQSFAVTVFRADRGTARYVDSIGGSDRMEAQVYDGMLHVTMPARTAADTGGDCCYAHIRVLDYTFEGNHLRKVGDAVVPARKYFQQHEAPIFIPGKIVKVWTKGSHRYARVTGPYSGTYLVAANARIAKVPSADKMLLVCKGDGSLPPFPFDDWRGWIITAAYQYAGGLD